MGWDITFPHMAQRLHYQNALRYSSCGPAASHSHVKEGIQHAIKSERHTNTSLMPLPC